MEKGSQLSSKGIEADATHQESNSLDVNENNRDGFDFSLSEKYLSAKHDIKDLNNTIKKAISDFEIKHNASVCLDVSDVKALEKAWFIMKAQ